MTVKEASEKFRLDVKEIRKLKKEGMIPGACTDKNRIFIPDDTKIIPSKKDIQCFLFQIMKYKNNPQMIISRNLCPDDDSLEALVEYLYGRGFIGEYKFIADIRKLFAEISLTEEGIAYFLGESQNKKYSNISVNPLVLNPTMKIGVINIG